MIDFCNNITKKTGQPREADRLVVGGGGAVYAAGFRPLPFRRPAPRHRRVPQCLCRWRRPDLASARFMLIVGRKPRLPAFSQAFISATALTSWPLVWIPRPLAFQRRLQAGALCVQVNRFEMYVDKPFSFRQRSASQNRSRIRNGQVPASFIFGNVLARFQNKHGCAAFARPASYRQRSRHRRKPASLRT